jgi:hypothetical protein
MGMSRKTINIDSEVHAIADKLKDKLRIPISEIVELLIEATSEKEILKLYNAKKEKEKK